MERAELTRRLRAAGCVYAAEEAAVLLDAAGADEPRLAELVTARCAGVPLEHVVGWAEFCGQRVRVAPGVFVPRARTQFLAERAAELSRPGTVTVDLCCGCGAVAAVVAARTVDVELHAADIDETAVRCARSNLDPAGVPVHQGDLYAALPARLRGRVRVLAANVPYVPSDEIALMPAEARAHEPRRALDGGADGLRLHRRVAAEAGGWLAPDGVVLVESTAGQVRRVLAEYAAAGLAARVERRADVDATLVVARRAIAPDGGAG